MLQLTININAPSQHAQGIKESISMFLERWGDSKVVEIKEIKPQDWENRQQRLF